MTADDYIDHPAENLLREIAEEERAEFAANGVVRLKAMIPSSWVDYLRIAVDRLMMHVSATSQNYTSAGQPRFFSQAFPRFVDPAFDTWDCAADQRHRPPDAPVGTGIAVLQ